MPLPASRVLSVPFKCAMYFDGVDDYVNLGNILVLSDLTIIVLVYPTTAKLQYILAKQTGTGYNRNYALSLYSNNSVAFLRGDGVSTQVMLTTTETANLNSRNFIAVRDGNRNIAVYVNSITPETTSYTFTPTTNNNPLWIGFGYGDANTARYFNGLIAEVLIYSRALSDSEILWNYNYPDNPIRNGLVLWLQADPQYVKDIDGDGVLEWIDISGYNNHGKIYGPQLVQFIKSASRTLQAQRVLSCAR